MGTVFAVLLLGGRGVRFGGSLPKQYVRMGGAPLFTHAARALSKSPLINRIVYVYPSGFEKMTKDILAEEGLRRAKRPAFAQGGGSREESAHLGLSKCVSLGAQGDDIIVILDADRPNLAEDLLKSNIENAKERGASITAYRSADSVCLSDGSSATEYLPRELVHEVQTPQAFKVSVLLEAFEKAGPNERAYTDEGSLVLSELGVKPLIAEGGPENFKVNEAKDMKRVERHEP